MIKIGIAENQGHFSTKLNVSGRFWTFWVFGQNGFYHMLVVFYHNFHLIYRQDFGSGVFMLSFAPSNTQRQNSNLTLSLFQNRTWK